MDPDPTPDPTPDPAPEPTVDADPGLILARVDAWLDGLFLLLPNIAVALVVLALFMLTGLAVARGVRRSVRDRRRADLGAVLGSLAKWALWLAGALIALTIVMPTLSPGDLIAGLGIGSVAVGFAFKDILQNMLAGLLILIRQPFRVGDQIVAGAHEGTVEHIETRATKIRTYAGRRVVIPNADVYTAAVTVNTAFAQRRSQHDFPIPLRADWRRAVEVALGAARGVEGVADDPAPDAQAQDQGDLAKTVRVRWWTAPQQAVVIATASKVRQAVDAALREAGFAPPVRTDLTLAKGDG